MPPLGKQTLSVDYGDATLTTYTYLPSGPIKGILLDFHGSSRNAIGARDAAIDMAEKYGLYIVAPLFPSGQFPNAEYQRGGVQAGTDPNSWTVALVDDMARWAHNQIGNIPGAETIAFGHSAGGQFLSRVAAYGPADIFDKIIIGNPSTHVRADLVEDMPYGFDNFGTSAEEQAALKAYLARPITLYNGGADNDPNAPDLATNSAAMRQGDDRLERAQFVYNEAKAIAQANGWEFNWEMVVAPGVGHSARGLFNSPAWQEAFDGRVDDGPVVPPPPVNKVYDFDSVSEANGTYIDDYKEGDVFDFKDIDAKSHVRGEQDFKFLGFVGSSSFTTKSGEVRLRHADGDTWIYLNSDGDKGYEARIRIDGIWDLTKDDFIL